MVDPQRFRPSPRVATRKTVIEKITILSPRVKNLRFKFSEPEPFHFLAGQYVQVIDPAGPKPIRRSYSIASPPLRSDSFDLCVTHVEGGPVSSFIHQLKEGDSVDTMGPLGKFILPETLPRDTVFIATGTGIAPFRSMLLDQLERKTSHSLYLLFGNRFEEDILYCDEWESLKRLHPNFFNLWTLSRPAVSWSGEKGYVQEKIQSFIPDPALKDFYLCGLNAMIVQVQEKLASLGVPKEQVHYERYD